MENSIENDVLGFDPRQLLEHDETNNSSNGGNNLIYHTRPAESVDSDGIYRSTIKVIYSPFDLRHSILEQQAYSMHDSNGWFQVVSSLTVNDKNCPLFKAWKTCHFAKQKDGSFKTPLDKVRYEQALPVNQGGKGLFDKRFARYVTIQVIEDKNHPELQGQYMFWKLPKSIYDMIDAKINPSTDSKKAVIPVMDFLFGYSIDLEVKPGPDDKAHPERKTRETSYTGEFSDDPVACTTPEGKSLLTDDEQSILDTYIEDMTKNVWKNKNVEDRATQLQRIREDENTKKLGEIYKNVLAQIKQFCPDLNKELGYHPWDDATKARVQNWINIVLAGNDPGAEQAPAAPAEANNSENKTTETATSAPTPQTNVDPTPTADADDDLPF